MNITRKKLSILNETRGLNPLPKYIYLIATLTGSITDDKRGNQYGGKYYPLLPRLLANLNQLYWI